MKNVSIWAVLLTLPLDVVIGTGFLFLTWTWFVVPLGAPLIGWWHAMGLRMVVSVLVFQGVRQTYESTAEYVGYVLGKWIALGAVVLFAYGVATWGGLR